MNLLIANGRVVDPSQNLDRAADVLIEDGVVAKIGPGLKAGKGVATIDAAGCVVVTGLGALHTHLREPGQEHKETIRTGTEAAVAGGYTSVCAMANTTPPNDERPVTEMIVAEAQRNGVCRVYPIGAVSKGLAGAELAEMADLRGAGCVAFSDDGKPVTNSKLMRAALDYARMLGVPVVAHEEDACLAEGAVMHEGYFSTLLGMKGAPAAGEEILTSRDIHLVELTGGRLHVAHVSTVGAIEAVRRAKARGLAVTCEVTPHHLSLTDEVVQSFSTDLKMNPPLRSEEHRRALIEAIKDGTIDAIATDHAPHHPDEKRVEFDLAPFGVIGLETAFAVCHDVLVRSKVIKLGQLVDLMSTRPARIFNLPGGTLKPGSAGDVAVIDLDGATEFASFRSRSHNSPWRGRTLATRVIATVVGGIARFDVRVPAGTEGKSRPQAGKARAARR